MKIDRVLVANRGEVAVRIARAAASLGMASVGVFSEDDARSLHVRRMDDAVGLRGTGPSAYLDVAQLVDAARSRGCEALHPGYGFVSERPELASLCSERGVRFVGPRAETLEALGDKVRARALAEQCSVRVLRGSGVLGGVDEARAFFDAVGARGLVLKALAGGGGRGMRVVRGRDEIEDAYRRCTSEAAAAFGNGAIYAEAFIARARHVEVQVLGDAVGNVVALGERECSLQRRYQKLIETAPPVGLAAELRARLVAAALEMARAARVESLVTFEFLVENASRADGFVFIEANPRLQVEHTVTEETTGVDLVAAQLEVARGATLAEIGLAEPPETRGFAIQVRVNMESLGADGAPQPSAGTLEAFEPPSGPGLRVDTFGYQGYATNARFDSLLAKVIAHATAGGLPAAISRAHRGLREFRVEGVDTNLALLQALLERPELASGDVHTRFFEEHFQELRGSALGTAPLYFTRERRDPVAAPARGRDPEPVLDATWEAVRAPLQGTVVSIDVEPGSVLVPGAPILVMEAMKMEHVVEATHGGVVQVVCVAPGETVETGQLLAALLPAESGELAAREPDEIDLDRIRPDLAEVIERHAYGLDARRPEAVERRRKTGQRTARENVMDLVDAGSFVEYGALVIAAQRRRREVEELIQRTPADGLIAGLGRVNGEHFGPDRARCIVMSYDYTVLAGTQGTQNHRKKDRMFELAEKWRLPLVLFAEGGGGRPGDSDGLGVTGLDTVAFAYFGALSGLVPLVGIASGRCFAGNAALLGCCDVVIATENTNIGMGGPAMIEGGGLGVFRPEDIGPIDVQRRNGVVDVVVRDEAEAVGVARRYLSYFQGTLPTFDAVDPRALRSIIPENRLRVYDVRRVLETLADIGSVLELRRDFGLGMVTALVRVEGRPLGVIANNPLHLAGAIDADAADKAARFMQLCDAFDLPILFLCDTPGIMVGPEAEKAGLVRHAARLFVVGASVSVPFFSIVLRKGYGLGAQTMAGGSFKSPLFMASWPTGEFGGMGLEGAVKLGFRRELDAIEDEAQRAETFERMVALAYDRGKATNVASLFELDAVIDPADSRRWILAALDAAPPPPARAGKKRPCIDTW